MSTRVIYDANRRSLRGCGECTLCCKLLPVRSLQKPANTKCKHQSRKGCAVYRQPWMPPECALWSCRWLSEPEATAGLSRPDRSRYVVDTMPDFITLRENASGAVQKFEVVQVWCDPAHREAHRDPALRAYLAKIAEEDGVGAIVRYGAEGDSFVLFAPALAGDGQWHEVMNGEREPEHTPAQVAMALGHKLRIRIE